MLSFQSAASGFTQAHAGGYLITLFTGIKCVHRGRVMTDVMQALAVVDDFGDLVIVEYIA